MLKKHENIILSLLILAGLIVALKLFHIDYMVNYSNEPYKSFCNINEKFNCDAVAASPYSRFLGVPIAFIGFSGNLFLIVFLFLSIFLKSLKPAIKHIYLFAFGLYAAICIGLAFLSFFFMSSICYVCMIFWLISIGTFIYLILISRGISFFSVVYWKELITYLFENKFIIFILLSFFLVINACTGFILKKRGCDKVSNHSFQCEHYLSENNVAFLGKESAKVEVVVYTDFECPWCRRAHFALQDLIKKYENQVRFIRKDFPLDMSCNRLVDRPFHSWACKAARLAKCAGKKGKYWPFHDEIYRNQEIMSDLIFMNIAKMLSLDWNELSICADSLEIEAALRNDIEEAISYGISATPSFRIFGEIFSGAINENNINDYLANYPAIKVEVLMRIFKKDMAKNIIIIDTRAKSSFEKGHISGALNMPEGSGDTSSFEKMRPLLLYDENGNNINVPFNRFKDFQFTNIHFLYGGYDAWVNKVTEK